MNHKTNIILVLLCLISNCFAQNYITKEGLKEGWWVYDFEEYDEISKSMGNYKIIPLSTYDTIGEFGRNCFEIKYKGSTPILSFVQKYNENITVRDSVWQHFDTNGNLLYSELWQLGLKVWHKCYDEEGNITNYHYEDFENDTSFYLTYKKNQLFKKSFYPPEDKNNKTTIYYPENKLVIQNAEPHFYTIFGDIMANIFPLKLSSKEKIVIQSIHSSSNNIQISFPFHSLPYTINSKDTITFNLIFTPTPSSLKDYDTITIITSETNVTPYKVYCETRATHIDVSNVMGISELTLSKSKDKYLIISQMGSLTEAFIIGGGIKKEFHIIEDTKIDISEFAVGNYDLTIYSCNTGGFLELKILE